MLRSITDERVILSGRTLHLFFRSRAPWFACDLKDATGARTKTAPVLTAGGDQTCIFDLGRLAAGDYSIAVRSAGEPVPFGQSIAEQQISRARGLGDESTMPAFVWITRSEFDQGHEATHVALYANLASRELRLRLTASFDGPRVSLDLNNNLKNAGRPPHGIDEAPAGQVFLSSAAKAIDDKLWGGFSTTATEELKRLRSQTSAPAGERIGAAWSLARWYAFKGEHGLASEMIDTMHAIAGAKIVSTTVLILESECYLRLGRVPEAKKVLENGMAARDKLDPDLCLAYANCFAADPSADHIRLEWINRVYRNAGLAPIRKAHPNQPLGLKNLAAPDAARIRISGGPKVSVIIPVYNAVDTVEIAIDSVTQQTWSDLEIIVVDDCSTDGTWDVIRALGKKHDAIVPIRQDRNQGAYAARNRGLEVASGDLITTHDSDDWSHPQQLETQVRGLIVRPEIQGSRSHWVRIASDFRFKSTWRTNRRLIELNWSSFMFRQKVRERLGAWDRVRTSADSEFINRAEAIFGAGAFTADLPDAPLACALTWGGSLTADGETHISTVSFGIRRDYLEAARFWLQSAIDGDSLRLDPKTDVRSFPAPRRMLPQRPKQPHYDVLIIMDFNLGGGAFQSTMNYLHACCACGQRVAVFQWRRYDLDVKQAMNPEIWALAAARTIDVISAGDTIAADVVLVGYPVILRYPIDNPPKVDFRHLVVVVNQMAYRLHSKRDQQYDPPSVVRVIKEIFGTGGTWVPISGLVRKLMIEHGGYPPPHGETWYPLIDFKARAADPLAWRGASGEGPVIGRHSRDHYTKWPSDRQAVLDAYCADKPCSVRLLGGAEHALALISGAPSNWVVYTFNSIAVPEFLRSIDIFIHYPHEDYIEEFGRAVIEAMAAGKPAILPPVFEQTFGPAALYAEPAEVWATVSSLWRNEGEYLARAHIGREFVRLNCGFEKLKERLAKLDVLQELVNTAS